MFGNPDFFKTESRKVPVPGNFYGWLFYTGWLAALAGPSAALLMMGKYIELLIWILVSVTWFSLDLFSTARQVNRRAEREQLFFVGEDDSHVSTENYDLNLRQPTQEPS